MTHIVFYSHFERGVKLRVSNVVVILPWDPQASFKIVRLLEGDILDLCFCFPEDKCATGFLDSVKKIYPLLLECENAESRHFQSHSTGVSRGISKALENLLKKFQQQHEYFRRSSQDFMGFLWGGVLDLRWLIINFTEVVNQLQMAKNLIAKGFHAKLETVLHVVGIFITCWYHFTLFLMVSWFLLFGVPSRQDWLNTRFFIHVWPCPASHSVCLQSTN